jgi:hypothetical protein
MPLAGAHFIQCLSFLNDIHSLNEVARQSFRMWNVLPAKATCKRFRPASGADFLRSQQSRAAPSRRVSLTLRFINDDCVIAGANAFSLCRTSLFCPRRTPSVKLLTLTARVFSTWAVCLVVPSAMWFVCRGYSNIRRRVLLHFGCQRMRERYNQRDRTISQQYWCFQIEPNSFGAVWTFSYCGSRKYCSACQSH